MNIAFSAAYYVSSTEEAVLTVGFADHDADPQHFLILQRAEETDEQDEELGQDTYYVEAGNPGAAGYGGIERVSITADAIVFTCSSTAHWCNAIETIEIAISPELATLDEIETSLREIFAGTPTSLFRP